MHEHCRMMPNMPGCERVLDAKPASGPDANGFDRSTASLADAKPQETTDLKDGETYALSADFVKKDIGGTPIRLLTYNGQFPGPILRVKQGESVRVRFKNNLDQPTTVHWHGIRVDNPNDGVPGVTQPQVDPGETFDYTLKFPDPGLYWYHPHMREDYQQELGMYGLVWVEPSDAKMFAQVNRQEFLALDDLLHSGGDVSPYDREQVNHTLMGRFGNTMLVNGREDYVLDANKNEVIRFAVVNTANTRVFRLGIPGADMKLVGGDAGAYRRDAWVDAVTLAPSERAVVDVRFPKAGTYALRHLGPDIQYTLGTIAVSDRPADKDHSAAFRTLQDRSAAFADLGPYYDTPVDKELDLALGMPSMGEGMEMGGMMMGHGRTVDGIEWEDTMASMNEASTERSLQWEVTDKATGKANDEIDYRFKRGDKVKIRIFNDGASMHPMQHPIHFHGNRFIVLAVDGVKNVNPVWKDTVLVPTGAKVDILLDASNPGDWMAHCHIAEHLHDGMMFGYRVE